MVELNRLFIKEHSSPQISPTASLLGEWDKLPTQGGLLGDATYSVTVDEASGGTVTGKPTTEVSEGTTITLTATANPGKWVRWSVEGIDPPATYADEIANTLTFIMPDNHVTITPFVDYVPNPVGEVKVDDVFWAATNTASATSFTSNISTNGVLVATNAEGVCPPGWRLPTGTEWTALGSDTWSGSTLTLRGVTFRTLNGDPIMSSGWATGTGNFSGVKPVLPYLNTAGRARLSSLQADSSVRTMSRCVRDVN